MCYLIAKRFDSKGCLSIELERNKALASLVSYLSLKTLDKGVQILTVSNKEMFGEYAPYTSVNSETEFIEKVLSM
jgi:hypothetical protein